MRLFIIRHGESEASRQGIGLGQLDGGLSPRGLEQARQVAKALDKECLDVIFTSPLERALRTAQEIAHSRTCPLIVDARLKERCMGVFEGKAKELFSKASAAFPEEAFVPAGGESMQDAVARAREFWLSQIKSHERNNVAIVSHNFLIKGLLSVALDVPLHDAMRYTISNGSITVLETDEMAPKARIVKINSTDYYAV